MKPFQTLVISTAALAFSGAAHAAAILHTEEASYAAALPAGLTEITDSFIGPPRSVVGNQLTFQSGIVSTANTSSDQGNFVTGLEYRGFVDSDSGFQPLSISWTMLPNTFGFAFDIRQVNTPQAANSGDAELLNLTLDDGTGPQTFLLYTFLSNADPVRNRAGFLGFTSDTPITSVLFSGTGGNSGDIFFVDNLRLAVSAPSPVPLPASLPLVLGALSGLFALRSRRTGPAVG